MDRNQHSPAVAMNLSVHPALWPHVFLTKGRSLITALLILCTPAYSGADTQPSWQLLVDGGAYTQAVARVSGQANNPLSQLIQQAHAHELSKHPMWRALLHYEKNGNGYKSQVDASYFFMDDNGKSDPSAELDSTLAAMFATSVKKPMRLTAYCRFVARRSWLFKLLPAANDLIPAQECPEIERFTQYLQAHTLTLVFPAAHPNSPSSAFGHTLIRIDKKDQAPETRLLNMSINFAAEVPPEVSSMAYALKGLSGGFQGKYRLLPYHIKLREYAQIENRDTWEYQLKLTQLQVDQILLHSYEMLISYYDYFFLSENCSYHLLSLLNVAFAEDSLLEEFDWWTIPIDTIKLLRKRDLIGDGIFVPSTIKTLRARRQLLPQNDRKLALNGWRNELASIDTELSALSPQRQAAVLDLLSDYNRYERLKTDPGASAMSSKERAVLSRRSKLSVSTPEPTVQAVQAAPELGHKTTRLSMRLVNRQANANHLEIGFRPAYHDFKDPAYAYGNNAAIDFFKIVAARDLQTDENFLRLLRLISIESIEPRGEFFKPISWHTRLDWERPTADARHRFTFNVGAGGAWTQGENKPLAFALLESDAINEGSETYLQFGARTGVHWEPIAGMRLGIEADFRQRIDEDVFTSAMQVWSSFPVGKRISIVLDASQKRESKQPRQREASLALRFYF